MACPVLLLPEIQQNQRKSNIIGVEATHVQVNLSKVGFVDKKKRHYIKPRSVNKKFLLDLMLKQTKTHFCRFRSH
jgi:hypothetical protein